MGSEAVKALAKSGDRVIMACRNLRKGEDVRAGILMECPYANIDLRELDLSSFDSVRKFASGFEKGTVDALFNNAGIISREWKLSPDSIENTIATNYTGPYLLTRLMLPAMKKGAGIVNMVSLTCRFGRVGKDFFDGSEKIPFKRLKVYSDSKLALLLFSIELSRRNPDLRVNVADPGVVNSNMISMGKWFDSLADIFFRPFIKSPAKGVAPALRALESGGNLEYHVGEKVTPISARYLSHSLCSWLWNETERICDKFL